MTASSATAMIAARPGLTRRCVTSSLTYSVPSQPPYTKTATRKPATALPLPSMPVRLNQPLRDREGAVVVTEHRDQARRWRSR